MTAVALGLDFGTESVRAVLVDLAGRERASADARFRHGQITTVLPISGERLPPEFALQHPGDWLEAAAVAVRAALDAARTAPQDVIGIGSCFTSCTMLPAKRDGTPLCLVPELAAEKFAWPKLWKHHGAQRETDRINRLARSATSPGCGATAARWGWSGSFPRCSKRCWPRCACSRRPTPGWKRAIGSSGNWWAAT